MDPTEPTAVGGGVGGSTPVTAFTLAVFTEPKAPVPNLESWHT